MKAMTSEEWTQMLKQGQWENRIPNETGRVAVALRERELLLEASENVVNKVLPNESLRELSWRLMVKLQDLVFRCQGMSR